SRPCNLRSHSEKHRRTKHHRPLHGDSPNDETPRLLRRVPGILDASSRNQKSVVQYVHCPNRRRPSRNPLGHRARAGHHRYVAIAKAVSQAGHAEVVIRQFSSPPSRPEDCIFALTTTTLSADL